MVFVWKLMTGLVVLPIWNPPGAHLAKPPGPPGAEPTWHTWRKAHLAPCFRTSEHEIHYLHLAPRSPPGERSTWHLTPCTFFQSAGDQIFCKAVNTRPSGVAPTWHTWREAHLAPTWRTSHLDLRSHLATWPTWRRPHLAGNVSTWREPHLALPPGKMTTWPTWPPGGHEV